MSHFLSSSYSNLFWIAGAGNNILQFYTDDSPGLQVGPTTVLVASLSFVGVVVLLHIWGKFRM
jgi:protein transport protein SEC61 subunit beta